MKHINDEKKIIEMMDGLLPKSNRRINKCFESDAEVISIGNKQFLFTIDEFSSEDMFRDNDPYLLGWNVVAGAISDITACAGIPLYYGHAMVVSESWDECFIRKFTQGIADVLKKTDVVFMGGDFGKADNWHYTATVIGKTETKRLSRKGAVSGDVIYMSGKVGTGNLEAALKIYSQDKRFKFIAPMVKNKFQLRNKEAIFIRDYANCCIDTSDGVFNALNTIADLNNVGYEIYDLPYINIGSLGASAISLPKELLFLGEAGEYELLFTMNQDNEKEFLEKAKLEGFCYHKLGNISETKKTLFDKKKSIDLSRLNIRARDFNDRSEYLKQLISYLKEQM